MRLYTTGEVTTSFVNLSMQCNVLAQSRKDCSAPTRISTKTNERANHFSWDSPTIISLRNPNFFDEYCCGRRGGGRKLS